MMGTAARHAVARAVKELLGDPDKEVRDGGQDKLQAMSADEALRNLAP
ncbi:MAG TPA: hypothetical protein VKA46_41285 [Gemmataceae bacterium]|nr:hypothetical protein [Gemmataceae bacterium]